MNHSLLKQLHVFEIAEVVEKATLFGGTIAQHNLKELRTSKIKRMDVDHYGTMMIQLNEDSDLVHDYPISIQLNYRNVSFNLDPLKFEVSGNVLIAVLPREAKALALRDTHRYAFPLSSSIMSSLHRIEKRAESPELQTQLIDVSQFGLGLVVHHAEGDVLLMNDHIWVKSINGIILEKPLFGRVVYAKKRKYKDDTADLRVGISLDAAIPEETFIKLQKMCRLVLTA